MPLYELKPSNMWWAFGFSAATSALVVVLATYFQIRYNKYEIHANKHDKNAQLEHTYNTKNMLIIFAITFAAYFLIYVGLYLIFDYKKV